MAFHVKSSLQAIASYMKAKGYIRKVDVGEPKNPPAENISACVFMDSAGVVELTLNSTIELHVVIARIYMNIDQEPVDRLEKEIARTVSRIKNDLAGEYDLGATIRQVDVGGEYGTPLNAEMGYIELGGITFRTADVQIPLVVDDSATLSK